MPLFLRRLLPRQERGGMPPASRLEAGMDARSVQVLPSSRDRTGERVRIHETDRKSDASVLGSLHEARASNRLLRKIEEEGFRAAGRLWGMSCIAVQV